MNPQELLDAGNLGEALRSLNAAVRDNPTDTRRRAFLFELLCFAGEFDRAEKQLDVLAHGSPAAATGALLYRAALHAERIRQNKFAKREFGEPRTGTSSPAAVAGTVNGKPFSALSDADPRVNGKLEVFAAGAYLWIPLEHIESIEIGPPRRLRDLLWAPAVVRTGPSFKGTDFGEVLLPVLAPLSWKSSDDHVRLGRSTVWVPDESGDAVPLGQRIWLVDEEEIPFLDIRSIKLSSAQDARDASS